jgi:hypothetical protein
MGKDDVIRTNTSMWHWCNSWDGASNAWLHRLLSLNRILLEIWLCGSRGHITVTVAFALACDSGKQTQENFDGHQEDDLDAR